MTRHPLEVWRFNNRLTLTQFGARVGASASALSRLERGSFTPGGVLLRRIADVTGLSTDEILQIPSTSQTPPPQVEGH